MTKRILFTALTVAFTVTMAPVAHAKVTLPDILSDNMVLQQSTTVNLWGKAAPQSTVAVTVSWSETTFGCMADENGRWLLKVETPTASYEPQTITFTDIDDQVTLTNILIGEVWLCSGQSNMEMPLEGFMGCPVEHGAELIATSTQWKGIRVATIPHTPALEPQEETQGKWGICSPETASKFTAVGYTFAQMLNASLNVPVGIIGCSWFGSSIEGWTSRELLDTYPDVDVEATFKDFVVPEYYWQWSFYLPGIMYNGMLYPLHNYTIKGFLWYQGCSNVGKHDTYPARLKNLVTQWRELWQEGDLPFYIVELAPYAYAEDGGYAEDGTSGARFRECQRKAVEMIPNSGIICTNDLSYPDESGVNHPRRKQEVGNRLAYLALNRTYGLTDVVCEGPIFKEMSVDGDEVTLKFYNDGMGFSPWKDIVGFEVAGEDRVFHHAEAKVLPYYQFPENLKVIVRSDEVQSPVAVRYCFKNFQPGNLTGACNMPAFPFRTDDWE